MSRGVAIVGYGKMGRLVEQLAPSFGLEVRARISSAKNPQGSGLSRESLAGADVAIDFSTPQAAPANILRLASLGVNVVSGTTGWYDALPAVRESVLAAETALVWGPNFSIGVNIFLQTVARAAELFSQYPDYEAWGWEIHHAAKKDAPSGTLKRLAEEIRANGYPREVNLASNRAGTIPGTHEIGFDSASDTITLRHTARNREGFARGALQAARWISGKKGVYEFQQIFGELAEEALTSRESAGR
jgi:4-hydroxy-tetrahydrodipicolinate reductase